MKGADIDLRPLSARVVFIADSHQVDRSTHRGLFNYTLVLRVSINNPADAIIHVVVSVNTIGRNEVRLWGHTTRGRTLALLPRYFGHFTISRLVKGPACNI